jgi:Domain of unknown function (DUF5658)
LPTNPLRPRAPERRRRALWSLLVGSLRPRRRHHRREEDSHLPVDWHDSHWLVVVILVLILSTIDALLTLTLIAQGQAAEANPVMAALVGGDGFTFALWKLGLTGMGVIILTILAGRRVFGWLRAGTLLYVVLFIYTALIGYEIALLQV